MLASQRRQRPLEPSNQYRLIRRASREEFAGPDASGAEVKGEIHREFGPQRPRRHEVCAVERHRRHPGKALQVGVLSGERVAHVIDQHLLGCRFSDDLRVIGSKCRNLIELLSQVKRALRPTISVEQAPHIGPAMKFSEQFDVGSRPPPLTAGVWHPFRVETEQRSNPEGSPIPVAGSPMSRPPEMNAVRLGLALPCPR